MSDVSRRDALKLMGAVPLVGALDWSAPGIQRATRMVERLHEEGETAAYAPKFFNAHEWRTVRVLSDMIIPKDERSGSATDAGVPQFMDFMMTDQDSRQTAMRGGLAWLDRECVTRFDKDFLTCTPAERTQVLDDISWPHKAKPEHAHGVAFFNSFRDLTASGFFTTKMGIADLQYMGNGFVPEWTGCPSAVLKKLGLGGETA